MRPPREERGFEREGARACVVHDDRVVRAVEEVDRGDGDARVGWELGAYAAQGLHFEILEGNGCGWRRTTLFSDLLRTCRETGIRKSGALAT